ncbi:MAG: hypothetical protein AVDCRST_MAG19-3720 [uncultured Thermomicrobiales bacterium]|uniref:Uncharacterized protein n=1 Tax=uncultured Thermomicrobiales bacterium TaxID=1645740 RepID=A0A6J4VJ63_9BACT|nr:MAG: hypothetical protein AVDCRST_MAG19-3720 [uncultured Thermomicrobiales bacterium]
MALVERVGEELARRWNRRQTIKRAGATVFGAVAAFSVKGTRSQELAGYCAYVTAGDCTCNPPNGTYCGRLAPEFCTGATCTGGCYIDESYRYVGGCWCSATCQYPTQYEGTYLIGHYQCCDCNCYGYQCACRQFVDESAYYA